MGWRLHVCFQRREIYGRSDALYRASFDTALVGLPLVVAAGTFL